MKKETVSMITTIDNPFDPFEDFASWFVYDSQKGYNTCGLLSLYASTSDSYSDPENQMIVDYAIDEIINNDVLGIYKKITKEIEIDDEEGTGGS